MAADQLGLGLAALGRPAYITAGRDADLGAPAERSIEAMEKHAHDQLDAAWWLGIRYIDAARSYGHAERFLGSWLAAHPGRRDELTIGSKWGYAYLGDWRFDAPEQERKTHTLAQFETQWPETLDALGTAPDVYLVHSLTPDSPVLGDAALLDRLRTLAADGLRVGFSTSGPRQGEVIDAALALPDSPFSAVQSTWNLLEPSVGPALARADAARWLVVVKEVFANGRLADTPEEADEALGAALAQPWADVVLTGAVTRHQLRANAQVEPTEVDDERIGAGAEDPEVYWAARSARPWV